MLVRKIRHAAWPVVAGCVALVACSNTPPAARAFVNATVAPGGLSTNMSDVCQFGSTIQFVTIGTPTAPTPTTVTDGNTQAGAPTHVTCSVRASGGGFDVEASATVEGLMGGTLTFTGHVDSMGGMGIAGTFTNAQDPTFSQSTSEMGGCTITYTGDPPPANPAVAPGRIWGHIDCEAAEARDQMVTLMNGMMGFRTCDAQADFLFEDCQQ